MNVSDLKVCPACGAKLVPTDSFCGDCGFDIKSLASAPADQHQLEKELAQTPPVEAINQQPAAPALENFAPGPQPGGAPPKTAGNPANLGRQGTGNKNALMIMVSLLVILFLVGGGTYWWLSRKDDTGQKTSKPLAAQNDEKTAPAAQPAASEAKVIDLSRASTYLSEPGLKCTFFVNYPDGMAGVVERISAQVVPNETVRVSEVETGVDQGEAFGYGFHYVERADGTYYILDQTPMEIFPVLKNNLTVGQTWNYQDEFCQTTWTVVDMGVDLNLGFATFEDCLLLKEDNQAVGFQSITYFAPGRGTVLVKNPGGGEDYYKMTAINQIDTAQAAATVKKWSPNYKQIKDDRIQN